MVNMDGGKEMNEKYMYVMKEIDKLHDVDCEKYNYEQLIKEVDEVLNYIDEKKKNTLKPSL
jgi:hypothetical protein